MKNLTLLFLLSFALSQGKAQTISVPVLPTIKDQVVQGPCYIFATTAALESRSLQAKCSSPDLSEWYFYSECVLGGYLSGSNAIPKVLEHTRDYGAVMHLSHFTPVGGTSGCANSNDPLVPCLFDIVSSSSCDPDFCRIGRTFGPGFSEDCKGKNSPNYFELQAAPYELNINEVNGKLLESISLGANPSLQLRSILLQGYGIIAGFEPNGIVNRPNNHGVFIYGFDVSAGGQVTWYYKDSWPNDAGLKTAIEGPDFNLNKLNFASYIVGEVPFDAPCESIQGPVDLYYGCSGNYSIPGVPACIIDWEMSDNINIDGDFDNGITISPTPDPTSEQAFIIARYGNCEVYFPINIIYDNPLHTPSGISTIDTDWNNGVYCPNSLIDFEVDDSSNQPFPATNYEWRIQGGTLLSGQGTPIILAQTGTSNPMTVEVRATLNGCLVSDWVLTTATLNVDCEGDIESLTINDQGYSPNIIGPFLIYDALGRQLVEGQDEDLRHSMHHLPNGLYFLSRVVNDKLQTARVLKR